MKKIDCRGICRVLGALVFAALLTACSEKSVDDVIDAARSKAAVGDYPTALVELRSGMQLHPSSALMRLEFARVLVSAGDYSAAQIELRKLLPEKELLNQAVPILAKLLTQVGQFNQAITEFEGYQLDGGTARADLLATMALAHGALQRVDK